MQVHGIWNEWNDLGERLAGEASPNVLALAGEIQTRLTVHVLTRACLDFIVPSIPSHAYMDDVISESRKRTAVSQARSEYRA